MGIELLILIYAMFINNQMQPFTKFEQEERARNISVLIAFGGSRVQDKMEKLKILINQLKKVYASKNIYVCYNFSTNYPDRNIVDNIMGQDVNYVCIPYPNKSYAITWTSINFVKTKYVLVIDDDIEIPFDINIPIDINIQNERTVNIWAYMICADKPSNNTSFFEKYLIYCQDIEYRFAGFIKQLASSFKNSTSLTHHGAISLYETHILNKIM